MARPAKMLIVLVIILAILCGAVSAISFFDLFRGTVVGEFSKIVTSVARCRFDSSNFPIDLDGAKRLQADDVTKSMSDASAASSETVKPNTLRFKKMGKFYSYEYGQYTHKYSENTLFTKYVKIGSAVCLISNSYRGVMTYYAGADGRKFQVFYYPESGKLLKQAM